MFKKFDRRKSLWLSFNEAGGQIAHDTLTGKNTSIDRGVLDWGSNENGPAAVFNVGPVIQVDNEAPPSSGAGFTFIGRIKTVDWPGQDRRFYLYGNPADDADYGIRFDFNAVGTTAGEPRFRVQIGDVVSTAIITSPTWGDGQCGNIAGSFDGSTLSVYSFFDDGTFSENSISVSGISDTDPSWRSFIGGDPVAGAEIDAESNWLLTVPKGLSLEEIKGLIYWADREKVSPQRKALKASVPAASGALITADQAEAGDTQAASIENIAQISVAQTEAGDTQGASVSAVASISASQIEEGDSQVASIVGIVTSEIAANQQEAGDSQSANISNISQISASQTEEGDSQSASIVGVLTSSITASQDEAGDSQAANLSNIISISANQAEAGDTQNANIVHLTFSNISANQLEAGDSQAAIILSGSAARIVSGYRSKIVLSNGSRSIIDTTRGYRSKIG